MKGILGITNAFCDWYKDIMKIIDSCDNKAVTNGAFCKGKKKSYRMYGHELDPEKYYTDKNGSIRKIK